MEFIIVALAAVGSYNPDAWFIIEVILSSLTLSGSLCVGREVWDCGLCGTGHHIFRINMFSENWKFEIRFEIKVVFLMLRCDGNERDDRSQNYA